MKKQGKLLVLLGVLIILAVAAYLVVSGANKKRAQEAAEAAARTQQLASHDAASITALSWAAAGESVTLDMQDGGWVYAYDSSFPLDTAYVDAMLAAVTDITASGELTDVVDYAKYGLLQPRLVITVSAAGGKSTYDIGNLDAASGRYYMRLEEEGSVYLVDASLYNAFNLGICDMAVLPPAPMAGEFRSLDVSGAGESLSAALYDEAPVEMYTSAYSWFAQSERGYIPMDAGKLRALAEACFAVAYDSCAAYAPDAAALAALGLGEGAAEISVGLTNAGEVFTLRFGSVCPENSSLCYVYVPQTRMVCRTDAALGEAVREADIESLRANDVCLLDFSTLDGFTVTLGGVTRTVAILRDGEGNSSYTLDGAQLDAASAEGFLGAVGSLYADSSDSTATSAGLEEQLSVTFLRASGTYGEMTLRLMDYSDEYSLVEFNGESRLLLTQEHAEELIAAAAVFGF